MILYLDTSAWLKLYVTDANSDAVFEAVAGAEVVAISTVGYAEARAALARVLREKRTTVADHRKRLTALNDDFARILKISVSEEIIADAGELAESNALRGFDAIHMASARWLSKQTKKPVTVLTFDERMRHAAQHLGLLS